MGRDKQVIGLKQSKKAIESGKSATVFLARDAENRITGPLSRLCESRGLAPNWVDTMGELGERFGINVGAAVAVLLKD